jgi:hypothetical protein
MQNPCDESVRKPRDKGSKNTFKPTAAPFSVFAQAAFEWLEWCLVRMRAHRGKANENILICSLDLGYYGDVSSPKRDVADCGIIRTYRSAPAHGDESINSWPHTQNAVDLVNSLTSETWDCDALPCSGTVARHGR